MNYHKSFQNMAANRHLIQEKCLSLNDPNIWVYYLLMNIVSGIPLWWHQLQFVARLKKIWLPPSLAWLSYHRACAVWLQDLCSWLHGWSSKFALAVQFDRNFLLAGCFDIVHGTHDKIICDATRVFLKYCKYKKQWRSQDITVARAQHGHTTFVRTFAQSAEAYRGVWRHPPPPEFYSLPGRFWGHIP